MQRVDAVVAPADRPTGLRIAAHERVERVGEHRPGLTRHLEQLGLRNDRPGLNHPLGRLRDVHRVIAHPLQVVGDLHRGGEETQVAGHRLLGRQQPDHSLLDVELDLIDRRVARDDRLLAVPRQYRVDGRGERRLGIARHVEERDLELGELVVEMPVTCRLRVHDYPNLPVMYASVRSSVGRVNTCCVVPNSTRLPT